MGRLAAAVIAVVATGAAGGCSTPPSVNVGPPSTETSTVVARLTQTGVDKIDLVLVVANSPSMADLQQILSFAVPDLLVGLLNPACLDASGAPVPAAAQPSPQGSCPVGTRRRFPPVSDVHIGLLSSSLGAVGGDACPDVLADACPGGGSTTSTNDHGHLVTRADACGPGAVLTWNDDGFLAWDPQMTLSPRGDTQLGGVTTPGIIHDLRALVVGNGNVGCRFASQNESWYRFLVDPAPYGNVALNGQNVVTSGIDGFLLQQRQDFLRPDSLLAIINVTDRDDESIPQQGNLPFFTSPVHLPHPRQECATLGPNDPCCASCGDPTPPGCPVDPSCTTSPMYTDADENLAIRTFGLTTHKQRYGTEFFYQPSRYVEALTSPTVQDSSGTSVPNPIFSVLGPSIGTTTVRDPSMVFYAAIVGVPWQLIARQANGVPDLVNGVSALDPTQVGGFKTPAELDLTDPAGNTFWADIAGDPEHYVPPISPYMQESSAPRSGTDPITGTVTAPPGSPAGTNPINGHELTIASPPGDIQYACIQPLPVPIDCSQPGRACDCAEPVAGQPPSDNPLCDPNPNDGMRLTLQTRAKAYPGLKHLAIARGMGTQGIVASICAAQLTDPTQPDYGYRPALGAIFDRLKSSIAGQCLPSALTPDANAQVPCVLIEARNTGGTACDCDTPGHAPVQAADLPAEQLALQDPLAATAGWNCFCEITQTSGADLVSCENAPDPFPTANGWCYVDDTGPTPIGNPALVSACPASEKREVRFVGAGMPTPGATVFITCEGS
jgi:hypothetical protein